MQLMTPTEHSDRVACPEGYRSMSIVPVSLLQGRSRPGARAWFVGALRASAGAGCLGRGGVSARAAWLQPDGVKPGGVKPDGVKPDGIAKQKNFKVLTVSAP